MPEPILAAQNTWWAPTNSSVTRASITEIEIMDSYTPTGTITDTWDASAAKDGSVTCYVIGTKLIIAGNGSGKVYANEDSSNAFGANLYNQGVADSSRLFENVAIFSNAALLDFSKCLTTYAMFQNMKKLQALDTSDWDISNVTNAQAMFSDCASIETLDVSNWDTSSCVDIRSMFSGCASLKHVDVSEWDLSSCVHVLFIFANCSSLESIDVSNWDVSKCTSLRDMFTNCAALKSIDISKWNTSACKAMDDMFSQCTSLTTIDVSNLNTSLCTNFYLMFAGCSALESLDVSNWDVSKAQFFTQMFENCSKLKYIKGLEQWDTSAGLGFDGMFKGCAKLEKLDLSSFNTTKAKNNAYIWYQGGPRTYNMKNMFLSCNKLAKVTVGPNWSVNGDGTNTTAANKAILPTPSSTYIPGADGYWYTFNGDQYAPNAMQDRTAATYYGSFDMVAEEDAIVKNGSLIDTAKAIRDISRGSEKYLPSEFGNAIRNLAVSLAVDSDGNATLVNAILSVDESGNGTIGV